MITIYDVARKAGVSVATVSKVFNGYQDVSEKTKQRVLKLADEMGFRPNSTARSLSMKKSWIIGVFFEDFLNSGFKHPFFTDIIESFKNVVGQKGYDLLFTANHYFNDREISYLEHCRNRNVDGVIILALKRDDPYLPELVSSNIPCISLDLDILGNRIGCVYSENIKGAEMAVKYLHDMGHQRIATITGQLLSLTSDQRLQGYKNAMNELKLPYRYDYVVQGDFLHEGGYQAMQHLLSLNDPPTAVFAAGDLMAFGAIKAIQDAGLNVPDDISIIGFDDIEMCKYFSPSLTTIKQNKEELGREAAEGLIRLIENPMEIPSIVQIPTELIVRETVANISSDRTLLK
jgi:LacI family transcriptional regulator